MQSKGRGFPRGFDLRLQPPDGRQTGTYRSEIAWEDPLRGPFLLKLALMKGHCPKGNALKAPSMNRARGSMAAILMERSVVQISRYLNRHGVPTFSQDTSRLLMCGFCRALRRHVAKLRRIELAHDLSQVSESHPTRSCTSEEDSRLDAEKAARQLRLRGRQMYELRRAGFEWREIARNSRVPMPPCGGVLPRTEAVKTQNAEQTSAKSRLRNQKDSTTGRDCNS